MNVRCIKLFTYWLLTYWLLLNPKLSLQFHPAIHINRSGKVYQWQGLWNLALVYYLREQKVCSSFLSAYTFCILGTASETLCFLSCLISPSDIQVVTDSCRFNLILVCFGLFFRRDFTMTLLLHGLRIKWGLTIRHNFICRTLESSVQ